MPEKGFRSVSVLFGNESLWFFQFPIVLIESNTCLRPEVIKTMTRPRLSY